MWPSNERLRDQERIVLDPTCSPRSPADLPYDDATVLGVVGSRLGR